MTELPLVLLAGFLGSSHCLGMCGPFAVAIGGRGDRWRGALCRQLVYTAGRICTYMFLGALAAFAGARLAHYNTTFVHASAWLAIAAGVLLLYQGLTTAGVLRRRAVRGHVPCAASVLFASLLSGPGWGGVFVAGLATGFLPCALLYGFLALAAATHHLAYGAALMGVFGLGTAPALVLAGTGSSLVSGAFRKRMFQFAAWCVVLTGAVSVARGVSYLSYEPASENAATCPLCER